MNLNFSSIDDFFQKDDLKLIFTIVFSDLISIYLTIFEEYVINNQNAQNKITNELEYFIKNICDYSIKEHMNDEYELLNEKISKILEKINNINFN